jgi:hypothetical protein
VRVRPRNRTSVLIEVTIPLAHAPSGKVTARIDPGDAVIETRERNNTLTSAVVGTSEKGYITAEA